MSKRSKARKKGVAKRPGNRKKQQHKGPAYRLQWNYLIGLFALTIIAFSPMFQNGFTNWDDILYVTNNKLLHSLSPEGLKAIFTTPLVSNYHPLTVLSLAIDYQLYGLEPLGYHLTSLFLHLVNVFLAYLLIMKLTKGNHWVAFLVAVVFAIHPMHVESVAWVSERKDLLYTLFFFLGSVVYLDYLDRGGVKRLFLVGGLFLLSLLSKPAAVVFPVVLLLFDYYRQRKFKMQVILEKVPYFVISILFGMIAIQIQSQKAIASLEVYSYLDRIQFAGFGFLWYIVKFFVPTSLSALHPFPVGDLNILYRLAPFLSAGLLAYILFIRKSRLWTFSILFYLVTVALVLQLLSVGTAVVAERYTYVPYIGIAFLAGMLLDRWTKRQTSKTLRNGVAGLVTIALLIFTGLTFMRTTVWKNSEVLWNDVLKKYPESHRAWTNRGLHFYELKEYGKAYADIDKGVSFKENFTTGIEWRGKTAYQLKNYRQAFQDADLLARMKPDYWQAFLDKGKALTRLDRPQEALQALNRALALSPNNPDVLNSRGVLYFNKLRKYQEALADFNTAIRVNPENGTYYLNRARCHYMLSQIPQARENVRIAKSLGTQVDASFENLLK